MPVPLSLTLKRTYLPATSGASAGIDSSSRSTLWSATSRTPPLVIACIALSTRFCTTWPTCPVSTSADPEIRVHVERRLHRRTTQCETRALGDQLADRRGLLDRRAALGEREQLVRHAARAGAGSRGVGQAGEQRLVVRRDHRLGQRQVAGHAHQDVVEVVRQAAGEHAERLEPGRLGTFVLDQRFVGDVAEDPDRAGHLAIGVAGRRAGDFDQALVGGAGVGRVVAQADRRAIFEHAVQRGSAFLEPEAEAVQHHAQAALGRFLRRHRRQPLRAFVQQDDRAAPIDRHDPVGNRPQRDAEACAHQGKLFLLGRQRRFRFRRPRQRLLRRRDHPRQFLGVPALFLDAAHRHAVGAIGEVERRRRERQQDIGAVRDGQRTIAATAAERK